MDGVINQIAFAQPQRVIQVDGSSEKDIANLKEWGLIPPAERVVIHTPLKQYELLVGRKMAINDSVYARGSGRKNEPVRILPNTVKDALEKDLSAFRSRNVFDFDLGNATKIASHIADTTSSGQQCEVDLEDGKWTLQLPLVARASDPDVQALLGKILGERVVDFVSDDASNLSPYGLTLTQRDALRYAQDWRMSRWCSKLADPCRTSPIRSMPADSNPIRFSPSPKSSVTMILKEGAAQRSRAGTSLPFDAQQSHRLLVFLRREKGPGAL